jgi:hypothetical protein
MDVMVALPGRYGVVWNIVGLLVTSLAGAGLVHVLSYHIPLAVRCGPLTVVNAGSLRTAMLSSTTTMVLRRGSSGAAKVSST